MVTIDHNHAKTTARSGALIPAGRPSASRRAMQYRRDYRLFYAVAFAIFLVVMPLARLRAAGFRGGDRRVSRSILEQVRTEANIVASYALMGF